MRVPQSEGHRETLLMFVALVGLIPPWRLHVASSVSCLRDFVRGRVFPHTPSGFGSAGLLPGTSAAQSHRSTTQRATG